MEKKEMSTLLKWTVIPSIVLIASGCQKPPQVEVDAMKQAVADAAVDQPSVYAPEAWQTAQQAVQAVDTEITAQNEKFALTRSYDRAKELIATADSAVSTARDQAKQTMQQITDETNGMLDSARSALATSRELLTQLAACKKRPKGFETDLELLEAKATGLATQIDEVDRLLAGGSLEDARALAETLVSDAEALATDLQNAKSQLGC